MTQFTKEYVACNLIEFKHYKFNIIMFVVFFNVLYFKFIFIIL